MPTGDGIYARCCGVIGVTLLLIAIAAAAYFYLRKSKAGVQPEDSVQVRVEYRRRNTPGLLKSNTETVFEFSILTKLTYEIIDDERL